MGGFTALHIVALNGHKEVVKLLLATEGINVNVVDSFRKRTALMYATSRRSLEIVELLLKAGGDLSLEGEFGKTAYDYAKRNRRPQEDP